MTANRSKDQSSPEWWLNRLTKLNVYKAKHGEAPHKPLLLLTMLQLAEDGLLQSPAVHLRPELVFRFMTLWPIVSYRRPAKPDIRMPFHRLKTEKFWKSLDANGEPSDDERITTQVHLNEHFWEFARDADFRKLAYHQLIERWFFPMERVALRQALNIEAETLSYEEQEELTNLPDLVREMGRSARFRLDVVPAYQYRCALTRLRITTVDSGVIVDAAHIHQFANSRNNDLSNGLSLCKNAHWMFDMGLWSLDDEYRVLIAKNAFVEDAPTQKSLHDFEGEQIFLPDNENHWPALKHIRWHREKCFLGSTCEAAMGSVLDF